MARCMVIVEGRHNSARFYVAENGHPEVVAAELYKATSRRLKKRITFGLIGHKRTGLRFPTFIKDISRICKRYQRTTDIYTDLEYRYFIDLHNDRVFYHTGSSVFLDDPVQIFPRPRFCDEESKSDVAEPLASAPAFIQLRA